MVSSRLIIAFILLVIGSAQELQPRLIMVESIIRHGARNPYRILGIGDQYAKEEQSLGELTTQGKVMHYYLGKVMYKNYWQRLFEGTPYQHTYHPSRFHVESTSTNRTIESAQAHLYGILEATQPLMLNKSQLAYSHPPSYPNTYATEGPLYGKEGLRMHPIPIHVYGRNMTAFDEGDFLTRFLPWECPNVNKWQKQNFANPKYQKLLNDSAYLNAVNMLSLAVGKPMSPQNFTAYFDNLECMQYRGIVVPRVFSEESETRRALESLYALSYYVKFFAGSRQIRAAASDLFNATIINMEKTIKNVSANYQWIVYSSHDVTIGTVLGAFEMWTAQCIYQGFKTHGQNKDDCILEFPGFASSLVFELYRYSNDKHTIKVNYNGQHRKIPFCGNQYECDFNRFKEWYNSWKVDDIRAACGAANYYTKESLISLGTFLLVTVLIWLAVRAYRGQGLRPKLQ